MKLKIGSVYSTTNKKFIKITELWLVGSKSGNLGDTAGKCLISTSATNFTELRTTVFTKSFVKKEITKEEHPEEFL